MTVPSIVANIARRVVQAVGLAVVTAACAHGQVEPSAPRIPIAVAPIGFGLAFGWSAGRNGDVMNERQLEWA